MIVYVPSSNVFTTSPPTTISFVISPSSSSFAVLPGSVKILPKLNVIGSLPISVITGIEFSSSSDGIYESAFVASPSV